MKNPVRTTQFKRDSKLAEKRGKKMSKLKDIMVKLINRPLAQLGSVDFPVLLGRFSIPIAGVISTRI